ncbi:MAG: NDP-sugar synthase [Chloroflexi bacterium]|nr:MAG: NDP-sugar synthase [Chloroflexota bacterium]
MIEFAVIMAMASPDHKSELTYNRPPAMLPALGKPLVVRIMERLYRAGIHKFVVVLGAQEGGVASYLNTSWLPDVEMEFVLKTGDTPIAHILSQIARQYRQPFVFSTYNHFTHSRFAEHLLSDKNAHTDQLVLGCTGTTLSKTMPSHYVCVDEEDCVVTISNRMPEDASCLILSELAICGMQFVDYLAGLTESSAYFAMQFADLCKQYLETGAAISAAETAWTLPIKVDADLLTLNKQLLEHEQDAHILSELTGSVQIVPPVRIDPQVSVGKGAQIGPYVYLERGCSIGENVMLRNVLVMQKSRIAPNEIVTDAIVSTRMTMQV